MSDINLKIRHAKRQSSQNLDGSNMNLEYLPNELFNLKSLISLNLSNNKIKELDEQIENLVNLKELNLENNELEELPKEIMNLRNLTSLNINNNPIIAKLKDYDIYWKTSLKNFFSSRENIKLNITEYVKSESNFSNKNGPKSFLCNNINGDINFTNNDSKTNNNKIADFKNISFTSINPNSNIPISSTNLNSNNNFNYGSVNTSQLASKKQILKEGEVFYKINKNSLQENEDGENKNPNPANTTFHSRGNINKNLEKSGESENRANSFNNTFSNINFGKSGKISNGFNSVIGKKMSICNLSKNSPISIKSLEKKTNNVLEEDDSLGKTGVSCNNDNNTNNSNENININYNLCLESVKNDESNIIQELERKNKEKDLIISDFKQKIFELETKVKNLNNAISNKSLGNIRSNSTKGDKPPEDDISQKRNWMDNNTSVIGTSNLDNSIFINNFNTDKSEEFKEIESKLQKEILNNKRMKNQIEKLSQQIASMQNSFNSNSDNLLKRIKEIDFEDIQIKNQIGQGGFSIIHKGIYLNINVAVKVLFDPNINEELLAEFNNEIKMLFLLRHPNIINLFGTSKSGQKLIIITEFLENGSLFDLLHKPGNEQILTPKTKIKLIKQILNAMLYLHSQEIVHRDLKSHNILLDENYNIKLCDFGLAKPKTDLNTGSAKFSGTPAYMAPEILQKKNYDEKVDIFAFGTLVWEIMTRKIPYEGVEINDLKQRICSEEKLFIPKSIPKEISKIIQICLLTDPNKRPTFVDLVKIPLE